MLVCNGTARRPLHMATLCMWTSILKSLHGTHICRAEPRPSARPKTVVGHSLDYSLVWLLLEPYPMSSILCQELTRWPSSLSSSPSFLPPRPPPTYYCTPQSRTYDTEPQSVVNLATSDSAMERRRGRRRRTGGRRGRLLQVGVAGGEVRGRIRF